MKQARAPLRMYARISIVTRMAWSRIGITVDGHVLHQIDRLVHDGTYANRGQLIAAAIIDLVQRYRRARLERECARLDRAEEQTLADEMYAGESVLLAY